MRIKDFDALSAALPPKWLMDQIADQARLAEAARAAYGASFDSLEEVARNAGRWAEEHQDILESVTQQANQYQAMMSQLQPQLDEHLAAYSRLLPEWRALDWSAIDSPHLQQMAEEARRQIEFFDQLGLRTPEAAARSEVFRPPLPALPPVEPRRAEPQPLPAEFVEGQGQAQLTLGQLTLKEGMWPEAESHFKMAAKWLTRSAEPHIGLGFVLNAQGKHQRAVKAFERAERLDPDCFLRADVRAAYEASLQGRRWDRQLQKDPTKGN